MHAEPISPTGDHSLLPTQAAGAFHAEWAANFCPVQNVAIELQHTECLYWDDDGTEYAGSYTNPVAGEDSGAPLDASAAVVVSWRVASHWKGGHPRSYIPGVTADRLDTPNAFTSATVTDYNSAVNGFVSGLAGASGDFFSGISLRALRRFADGGSLTVPKTYLDPPLLIPITGHIVRSHIGSQRRRLGHF